MAWYDGLVFRSQKSIKTKGDLYYRCLKAYRSKTKDSIHSRDVATLSMVSPNRFSSFLNGQWEDIPEENFLKALECIKLPYEQFKSLAKKSAIPSMGIYAPVSTGDTSLQPKPHEEARTTQVIPQAPLPKKIERKPEVKKVKKLQIINHVLEGFLAVTDADGNIHLYENTPETAKLLKKAKWTYVAPADEVGGKVVARASIL